MDSVVFPIPYVEAFIPNVTLFGHGLSKDKRDEVAPNLVAILSCFSLPFSPFLFPHPCVS